MIDKNKCIEFEMFDVSLGDSLELQIFFWNFFSVDFLALFGLTVLGTFSIFADFSHIQNRIFYQIENKLNCLLS